MEAHTVVRFSEAEEFERSQAFIQKALRRYNVMSRKCNNVVRVSSARQVGWRWCRRRMAARRENVGRRARRHNVNCRALHCCVNHMEELQSRGSVHDTVSDRFTVRLYGPYRGKEEGTSQARGMVGAASPPQPVLTVNDAHVAETTWRR